MKEGGCAWMFLNPSFAKAMWAPWWRHWARRRSAPSIRWMRWSSCATGTASGCRWRAPMAASSRGTPLFRGPAGGRCYKHDAPYTYFTSKQLHLGEISLECSRAGASAVALWATQQLLPYTPGGAFAQGLVSGHAAALKFYEP